MSSADDILGQIDDALEDWSVSDDAMRSRPAAEPGIRGATPTVQIMDEVGEWQELRGVTGIELHIDSAEIDPEFQQRWEEVREHFARLHLEQAQRMQAALNETMAALAEAVKPAAEAANRGIAEIAKALQRSGRDIAGGGQRNYRHLPEAAGCNDCGTPAPRRDRPAWQSPYGPAKRRR